MEYWLSYNNNAESLQLPVPPGNYEIPLGNNNTTIIITSIGEINLIGKGKLATITLESFFPAQEYYFCQYTGFPEPYECVKMIKKWWKTGNPIRLIITETDINIAASIENFTYGEQDGTGDVYFTLELKEYRVISIKSASSSVNATSTRQSTRTIPKTYTVKSGDSLYMIAKRLTGSGANYKAIAQKNGLKNPGMIKVGQKLVIS